MDVEWEYIQKCRMYSLGRGGADEQKNISHTVSALTTLKVAMFYSFFMFDTRVHGNASAIHREIAVKSSDFFV